MLADLCYRKKLYRASAEFWRSAFAERPELAAELASWNRYNAACSAALAGSGEGQEVGDLDEQARARWREQALAWLRADLLLHTRRLESGTDDDREQLRKDLEHWKRDPDLAGIREASATALPAEEREACRQLWADVDALLARTR